MDLIKQKTIAYLLIVTMLVSAGLAAEQHQAPPQLKVNKQMFINFVKSLVIPGWGQWSNGHKGRAIAYVGAELATIYGYQVNYSQATDEEHEFKEYADGHWNYGIWSLNDDGETACGNLRTHAMPTLTDADGNDILDSQGYLIPLRDHHFYENISKYPEFVCGWDDIADMWEEGGNVYTPNKFDYIEMRTHSNDLFKNAQLASTLILVNHLISAFDAALGTDLTTIEATNFTGKLYINPLNAMNSIRMEVRF